MSHYPSIDEINEILSVLPVLGFSASQSVSENMIFQLKKHFTEQLLTVKIESWMIEDLKKTLYNKYIKSLIHPGEPVGITTGEGLGQQLTQINLNTFHLAGSSFVVSIDSFTELLNATQNRKYETMTIHYKQKNLTYDEVYNIGREFESVPISKLIISHSIIKYTYPDDEYSQKYLKLSPDIEKFLNENEHTKILEIVLDKNKLFRHNATPGDIINAIEYHSFKTKTKGSDYKTLYCIPNITNDIWSIRVYPSPKTIIENVEKEKNSINTKNIRAQKIKHTTLKHQILSSNDDIDNDDDIICTESLNITNENLVSLFINNIFLVEYGDINVKGIEGITSMTPVSINIISLICTEMKVIDNVYSLQYYLSFWDIPERKPLSKWSKLRYCKNEEEKSELLNVAINGDLRILWLDKIIMLISGITMEIFYNLLESQGVIIYDKLSTKRLPYMLMVSFNTSVKKFIQEKKNLPNSSYVYSVGVGKKLDKIIVHPLIDPKYTFACNIHEMLKIFGIEAANSSSSYEFNAMIASSGSYSNSKFIKLIPDVMTREGRILPITSRGAIGQERGVLVNASFDRPVENFLKSSLSAKKESLLSTSACNFIGKRFLLGTGSFSIGIDESIIRKIKTFTLDDLDDLDDLFDDEKDDEKDDDTELTIINMELPPIVELSNAPQFIIDMLDQIDMEIQGVNYDKLIGQY